jgi:hypothetical protein
MNMRKALPLLVIASMMISLIPSVMINAAPSFTISVATGPVGTKTIVSGTIDTWNGSYEIYFDSNGDGATPLGERVATGTATGYSFTKEITVPDATSGAKSIRVRDITALPNTNADKFFTVTTEFKIVASADSAMQGAALTAGVLQATITVTGGDPAWVGALDLQMRVKTPGGAVIAAETQNIANVPAGAWTNPALGKYTGTFNLPAAAVSFNTNGVYTMLLDWDDNALFDEPARQGVATDTFLIGITDKSSYERTEAIGMQAWIPAGKTTSKWTLTDPSGVEGAANVLAIGPSAYTGVILVDVTTKDDLLGVWTVKFYDNQATPVVFLTATYTVTKANIVIASVNFFDSSAQTAADPIGAAPANSDVPRMHTVTLDMALTYPSAPATPVSSADLPAGFDVKVCVNGTVIATIHLDPLTDYTAPNIWSVDWKVPKDLAKGQKYEFNVTAASMTDAYGNGGPKNTFSTRTVSYFTVTSGVLYVTSGPTLNFPSATNTLARTLTSKVLAEVKYADGTRFTGSDLKWFNVTVDNSQAGGIAATYTKLAQGVASDYSADTGLWIIKWAIPYNAPISPIAPVPADYGYQILASDIEDMWGNKGPGAPSGYSGTYYVGAATIAVSDVTVDKSSVQTDEQITVSYKATYPSGEPVTTKAAGFNKVDIIDSGAAITTKVVSYDSATQKWKVAYIIPTGSVSGTWNGTVQINYVQDDAGNQGPTAKKYANFEVSRVSLTDVLAASDAAKASADLAQTKADAAKTAADTAATKADAAAEAADDAKTAATAAGTKADAATSAANSAKTSADGAKTAADSAAAAATAAGTKADAATTAANNAKTAADSAAAAANGLTTLVYAAIGASLVAALAAIVALMQISRKIA